MIRRAVARALAFGREYLPAILEVIGVLMIALFLAVEIAPWVGSATLGALLIAVGYVIERTETETHG